VGTRPPRKFPDGSTNGHRLGRAAVRAIDAYMMVARKADELADHLDQLTAPGVIRALLSDEDSLVIVIKELTEGREI
jgi:hypothetical protein